MRQGCKNQKKANQPQNKELMSFKKILFHWALVYLQRLFINSI